MTDNMMFDNDNCEWMSEAKCKGHPAEIWFVDNYQDNKGRRNTVIAKSICASCSVAKDCLEYANDNKELFGVWGGLTPKERGVGRLARLERNRQARKLL